MQDASSANIHYVYCILYNFYVVRIVSCAVLRREILSSFIIIFGKLQRRIIHHA